MNSAEMRELFNGVASVTINYAGSGDSGSIESVEGWDSANRAISLTNAQRAAVKERCYALLNDLPDWVNNEGGFGDATFDVGEDQIDFNHSVNTSNSDSESTTYNRESLPHMLTSALTHLPPVVTRILHENGYDNALTVCLDADGRRFPYPEQEDLEHAIDLFTQDVINQSNANRDDCQQELSIDLLTYETEVIIKWNETTSEAEGHSFTFSEDDDA